jgi:hypothetical protein
VQRIEHVALQALDLLGIIEEPCLVQSSQLGEDPIGVIRKVAREVAP